MPEIPDDFLSFTSRVALRLEAAPVDEFEERLLDLAALAFTLWRGARALEACEKSRRISAAHKENPEGFSNPSLFPLTKGR